MLRPFTLCACLLVLAACSQEQKEKTEEQTAASQASTSVYNPIASAVLNVEQGEDILQSSKQAMLDITASDIAAASQAQFNPDTLNIEIEPQTASSLAELPPLPDSCQRYFQRAQNCYQTQAQAEGLINMLQQQQIELAAENPDEAACKSLATSFDAVAINLGCP